MKKVNERNWNGAIFAAAGLERIDLRPENSIDLDWMLPSPAQGAIVVVCRSDDDDIYDTISALNHADTAICTKIEKDFLRTLYGGCSTPISALARIKKGKVIFKGNICSLDGKQIIEIEKESDYKNSDMLGSEAGNELLKDKNVQEIIEEIRNAKK